MWPRLHASLYLYNMSYCTFAQTLPLVSTPGPGYTHQLIAHVTFDQLGGALGGIAKSAAARGLDRHHLLWLREMYGAGVRRDLVAREIASIHLHVCGAARLAAEQPFGRHNVPMDADGQHDAALVAGQPRKADALTEASAPRARSIA